MQINSIKTEIVEITPVLASGFLAKSKNFRALNEIRAEHLAEQIKQDRWQLNGESIKFDAMGNLIDGQHRCKGVVLADKPIQSVVVWGVESDANIDTGANRTTAQLLHSRGNLYATQLSAMVGFVFRYKKSRLFQSSDYISRDDTLNLVEENPRMWEAIQFTAKTSQLFGRWSLHAALYFLFANQCDVDHATRFYQSLMDGAELSATNPIYHLRERLISNKHSDVKLQTNAVAGITIKCWNAYLKTGEMKQLRYNFQREGIPDIVTEKNRQDSGLKFADDE